MEINKRLQDSQNFCRKKLCGQSFSGQDLSGADFSQSDIRGADFRHSNLSGTKFSHCRAGLTPLRTIIFIVLSWLLAAIAGLLSSTAIYFSLALLIPPSLLPQVLGSDYVPGLERVSWLTPILFVGWLMVSRQLGPIIMGVLGGIVFLVCVLLAFLEVAGVAIAHNLRYGILAILLGGFAIDTAGAMVYASLKVIASKHSILTGFGVAIQGVATIGTIKFLSPYYHSLDSEGVSGVVVNSFMILITFATAMFSAFVGAGIFQDTDNRP